MILKKLKNVTEQNRQAWNVATQRHREIEYTQHLKNLLENPENCLNEIELRYFKDLSIKEKRIAHIACNKGNELMSLVKMGANTNSVGFDISDTAIQYALDLSQDSSIECQFERINLYEIDENRYRTQFDIVYISVGAIGWFPDIDAAFKKMAILLKPAGHLFISEMHPILDMYKPDDDCSAAELAIKQPQAADSYFRTEAFITETGLDYVGHSPYEGPVNIWYHHKLSDVIMAGINAGLALRKIEELEADISMSYSRFKVIKNKPPLSYALLLQKYN